MGFFSAIKLGSLYEKRLRAYGLEPRELPPDLHSTICSSFERRSERYADNGGMTGRQRSDFIESNIEGAADLLVLCLNGPQLYNLKNQMRGFDGRCVGPGGLSADEIIEDLVRTWISYGADGSIELNLMNAVNQMGLLNLDFANAFKAERAKQMNQ